MTSLIDPTLPIVGTPTTASVRSNFQIAHDEITALQAASAGGPFLPLSGGIVGGQLTVAVSPGASALNVRGGAYFNVSGGSQGVGVVQIYNGLTVGAPILSVTDLWVGGQGGARFIIDAFQGAPTITGRRANGTDAAPTGVLANDNLLGIGGFGHDGAAFSNLQGGYFINALNPWSPTDHSTFHAWNGTNSGATGSSEKMRLINGHLLIGSTVDAGFSLDVTGTARVSGQITATGGILAGGTVTLGTAGATQLLAIAGPAGSARAMRFLTAGTVRWQIAANTTAEGSNAGSDLDITNYADAGTAIGANPAIRITRATGNVALAGSIGVNGTTPPAKPTVSGAKGSNAALASLLAALVSYGLITDTTTA